MHSKCYPECVILPSSPFIYHIVLEDQSFFKIIHIPYAISSDRKEKPHPKKTNKKASKSTSSFQDQKLQERRTAASGFCVLSFTQGLSLPPACCANSVTLTQEWSCYIRLNSVCETQVPSSNTGDFYKKPLHIHFSGLLIPQIFLLHATNTTNLLEPANWTSARTPIIHKHSAWCVGCAVHRSGNNQWKKWT